MPLKLELQVVCRHPDTPTKKQFQSWLRDCFADAAEATVVVRVVDETESAQLNQDYRDKNGPTNVLSFPFEAPPGIEVDHLGDLVICAPLVAKEAGEQGKAVQDHWAHLLLHGVLHLQGYDHLEDDEAAEMEAKEIELLQRLGIANPYES